MGRVHILMQHLFWTGFTSQPFSIQLVKQRPRWTRPQHNGWTLTSSIYSRDATVLKEILVGGAHREKSIDCIYFFAHITLHSSSCKVAIAWCSSPSTMIRSNRIHLSRLHIHWMQTAQQLLLPAWLLASKNGNERMQIFQSSWQITSMISITI